jgi:4-hydroxybenzoate polyprenyltransferase
VLIECFFIDKIKSQNKKAIYLIYFFLLCFVVLSVLCQYDQHAIYIYIYICIYIFCFVYIYIQQIE